MPFYYTALSAFDESYDECGLSWEGYLQWSRLTHIKELVSLDRILNKDLVGPDYTDSPNLGYTEDDWKYLVTDGRFITGFYTSLDYVLQKMPPRERFNLLAVIINPTQECHSVRLSDFAFMGYELLDCNNLNEPHADTNVIGIWRHSTIGREQVHPPLALKPLGHTCNIRRPTPN
ncbi:hypothetical protein Slin_2767 [Spirosoma linguale DSM 74]|uniref:Uncharacterized protein n=1 Tax=Spirosoma linguale (strain ATCC 33905 / DSM 74 / LMG 10896 / Claus 1) TaxID=504472 RepID=D2QIJ8_SPILD|nr:hypothetical protein Slin_2767 [Spirosoma linguale DSM 74]